MGLPRSRIPLSRRRHTYGLSAGSLPRGIRNNNPGNLILTSIKWQGKVPNAENTDGHFEQFTSMALGVRAMLIDLKGDIEKDGLNTLTKLITKYAPPRENNTKNYITLVAAKTGIGANSILSTDKSTMLKVGSAITGVENGWLYQLPISEIERGYNLMGGNYITEVVNTAKMNPKTTIGIAAALALGIGIYALNEN